MRPSLERIKQRKQLVGAEIGVQNGYNAMDMLEHLDLLKLYLIDPYTPFPNASNGKMPDPSEVNQAMCDKVFEEVKKKFEKYNDKIIWIRKYSWDASNDILDGELDFVYIDGDHRTEILKKDITLYLSKVKIGGLLAGHDFHFDYVRNGVNQMLSRYETQGDDWWFIRK